MECWWIIPQQETSGNYNKLTPALCLVIIIPQQETSGNYNAGTAGAGGLSIIPQQETSGNYNVPGDGQAQSLIIPQQETSGNYNFDYSTGTRPVQPPWRNGLPFPSFPGLVCPFSDKCYFCYSFIIPLSLPGTPSGKGVLHIIHRVIHAVMLTAVLGKKSPFPLGKFSGGFFRFQLTIRRKYCMITEYTILKTILWGALYDL